MQRGWRRSQIAFLAFGVVLIALFAPASPYFRSDRRKAKSRETVRSVPVRRIDWLTATITAAGRAASMNNSEIRCKLERLTSPGGGGSVSSNGSSTILSVIPDGSVVKKGDLLCELDSAEYQELVRRQTIGVQKAMAEHREAQLNLEIAEISLQSYLEGSVRQAEQEFEGQVALNTSGLARQEDRLAWAQRMLTKGYVSLSQVSGEEETLLRLKFALDQIRMSYQNYQRYSLPRDKRSLQSQVDGARVNLSYQTLRLKLERDRLALFEDQVNRCTIRAPNDGFVIYADEPGQPQRIWEGASIRQRQRMFYLPDLDRMEVQTMVHETVIDRVDVGMAARVRFEALPGRSAEGRVTSVARLPLLDQNSSAGDVKYYLAVVRLDQIPSGLRPGMSAEIEIVTSRLPEALVLPPVAITVENGKEVCYVIGAKGIERREIKVGQRNSDYTQVLDGLEEGEKIVLEPSEVAVTTL
ncbi:efflux RND transporter periplasmic adaptor subunit [Singulisphaera acidiphila]|uniref:RND family efflux transporter, MFP subunit n=1 Tax=Singulisphaera acidiphila (strain ATCC BAA-1392 / DSM 18658 / VKM B-2454 / MOB10) TaxID=886293 RepID=L0DCZ0_SINAD|nr:efflux RND transporter periplasmic adaptor subunit [Singulisphaera acidiphila]AGA26735.1 RND family efflux transporter, MFP subunit [Singulisphaera acidiphila DSM 18658]